MLAFFLYRYFSNLSTITTTVSIFDHFYQIRFRHIIQPLVSFLLFLRLNNFGKLKSGRGHETETKNLSSQQVSAMIRDFASYSSPLSSCTKFSNDFFRYLSFSITGEATKPEEINCLGPVAPPDLMKQGQRKITRSN